MLRYASNRRLVGGAVIAIGALAGVAGFFYQGQNTSNRIGGAMAPQKLAWLYYAVVLWVVLPLAIALDRRVARRVRQAFGALFILMTIRGVVELWMLYVLLNWSPWYGIAHDLLRAAALGALAASALRTLDRSSAPNSLMMVHLLVTSAAFIPEIYFAHYMTLHFDTAGSGAIYFVPDEERYQDVLAWTTRAVVLLSVYLPIFLWGWLIGTPDSTSL